jgi:hypothetical protein
MDANALTRCREAMIRALNGQFPDERYREPACWPACEALLPHVKAVVESVADENGAWSETAGLLTGMGAIAMRGLYAEA